jgi:hypothetical protein
LLVNSFLLVIYKFFYRYIALFLVMNKGMKIEDNYKMCSFTIHRSTNFYTCKEDLLCPTMRLTVVESL